jgi:hypothetical protein
MKVCGWWVHGCCTGTCNDMCVVMVVVYQCTNMESNNDCVGMNEHQYMNNWSKDNTYRP